MQILYVFQDVEKIVVRDFFPDLPKLHAQSEFLEALEKNDVVKLREIHIKYGPKRDPTSTPRDICETPFLEIESHSSKTNRIFPVFANFLDFLSRFYPLNIWNSIGPYKANSPTSRWE